MSNTWILVANSSTANIYVNSGPNKGLQLIKEFSHPESREKASELASDRPGHNQGHGGGHGSFVPATDPKHNEAEHFAKLLAHELEQGRATNNFSRLILVASPPFIGLLNSELEEHVRNLVTETIEKDYTRATEKELAGHLEHCVFV
jgi:protein required for attachment to host cells